MSTRGKARNIRGHEVSVANLYQQLVSGGKTKLWWPAHGLESRASATSKQATAGYGETAHLISPEELIAPGPSQLCSLKVASPRKLVQDKDQHAGGGRGRGRSFFSCIYCSILIIDNASLSRWSTVLTPKRDRQQLGPHYGIFMHDMKVSARLGGYTADKILQHQRTVTTIAGKSFDANVRRAGPRDKGSVEHHQGRPNTIPGVTVGTRNSSR